MYESESPRKDQIKTHAIMSIIFIIHSCIHLLLYRGQGRSRAYSRNTLGGTAVCCRAPQKHAISLTSPCSQSSITVLCCLDRMIYEWSWAYKKGLAMTKTFLDRRKYDGLNLLGCAINLIFIGHEGSACSRCSAVHNGLHTCYKRVLAHTQQAHNHALLLDQCWEDCGNHELVNQDGEEWRKQHSTMLAWIEVWDSSRVRDMDTLI